VQAVPAQNDRLARDDFDLAANTPGEESVIAEFRTQRPLYVREGKTQDLALVAYQQETTDGTADNTETFALDHSVIQSDATPENVVLYEKGQKVQPDAVDYDNDTIDYTDDGTDNRPHTYYTTDAQSALRLKKAAPNTVEDLQLGGVAGRMRPHRQDGPAVLGGAGGLTRGQQQRGSQCYVERMHPDACIWGAILHSDGNGGRRFFQKYSQKGACRDGQFSSQRSFTGYWN
jgi:hypothetical protein